jgi:hypothetical protein
VSHVWEVQGLVPSSSLIFAAEACHLIFLYYLLEYAMASPSQTITYSLFDRLTVYTAPVGLTVYIKW